MKSPRYKPSHTHTQIFRWRLRSMPPNTHTHTHLFPIICGLGFWRQASLSPLAGGQNLSPLPSGTRRPLEELVWVGVIEQSRAPPPSTAEHFCPTLLILPPQCEIDRNPVKVKGEVVLGTLSSLKRQFAKKYEIVDSPSRRSKAFWGWRRLTHWCP